MPAMFWNKSPMPATPPFDPQAILAALDTVIDPHLAKGLDAAGCVKAIHPTMPVKVEIELGFPAASIHQALSEQARQAIKAQCGINALVQVSWAIAAAPMPSKAQAIPGIANIIAVASGKGGVGKSTVSANLALALAAEGARVGLLDADIYGPSQPQMMGVGSIKPSSPDGKRWNPVMAHGVALMSIGFHVDPAQPMLWRGPMATQALQQLLTETVWPVLDYLIIDLPPGTGDIQLTLAQRIPVSAAVIVTTPQDIALLDARKGLEMFRKVAVPVLGIVENMAVYCCPNCGHEAHIFGSGGASKLAEAAGTEVLGALPLLLAIREQMDAGNPTVAAEPDGEIAARYRSIARLAAARLAHGQPETAFPSIEIA
jgi:ATP-binding protein involved in chromosome partitioning